MYTPAQIREYAYILTLLTDLDSLKQFWEQDPKLANTVEFFNAIALVLEGVEALNKQQVHATYLSLVRYFAEEVLENGILMGAVEKNIKDIVPIVVKKGYLESSRLDDVGVLSISSKGQELLRLKREVAFLTKVSEECLKH